MTFTIEGNSPNKDSHLLDILLTLNQTQIEILISKLKIPRHYLSSNEAPTAKLAVELLTILKNSANHDPNKAIQEALKIQDLKFNTGILELQNKIYSHSSRSAYNCIYKGVQSTAVIHHTLVTEGSELETLLSNQANLIKLPKHSHVSLILDSTTIKSMPCIIYDTTRPLPFKSSLNTIFKTHNQKLFAIEQVCQAVHLLHMNNLTHDDLRPSSLYIDPSQKRIKIHSYAIKETLDKVSKTDSYITQETHAPQHSIRYLDVVNPSSTPGDIYSLALLSYRIIFNKKPWKGVSGFWDIVQRKGSPFNNKLESAHPNLFSFLHSCIDLNINNRPCSITEFRQKLLSSWPTSV